ncbi:MAG: hypothetical protein JSV56_00430, partial [Methanomassiliicoccales archaeon]
SGIWKKTGNLRKLFTTIIVLFALMFTYPIIVQNKNVVCAQDTQIPSGWLKFNPHSHGMFDVHDENDNVVGTIDESHIAGLGWSTGDTVEMIRDDFGAEGVMVHTPHAGHFEPYKEYWESEKRYENQHYSTTTNVTMGEEYNHNGRHIGLANITTFFSTNDYQDFKDLRSNVTTQGGIMIVNHPSDGWIGNPPMFLQPGYEFDAMEVYNGRVELVDGPLAIPETDGRTHYRNAVTQGRLMAACGGSDAHNTVGGWQVYTVVEDPQDLGNLDAAVDAIRQRRTYAAAYDMSVYDRSFFIECDLMGKITVEREIELNVTPPSTDSYTVEIYKNNETDPAQTWSLTGESSVTYSIPNSDAQKKAAYSFEIFEGSSAETSDALVYTSAIWYQPVVSYNLSLNKGWNLVSIPVILENPSIVEVLSSIEGDYNMVQWYDALCDSWLTYPGDSTDLSHHMAFWIHMKTDSVLEITGISPFYTAIELLASGRGWNLVGYPAMHNKTIQGALSYIEDKYVAVQNFKSEDEGDPWKHYHIDKPFNDLHHFNTGRGYWIKVNCDCEWVVFN